MDVLVQLGERCDKLYGAFRECQMLKGKKNLEGVLKGVLDSTGVPIPDHSPKSEILSASLAIEIIGNAMEFAYRKGFGDKDSVEFLRLYIKVLERCKAGKDEPGHTQLLSAVKHFKDHFLSHFCAKISSPFSTMAVEYVFSTIFTHFYLYQLVLCDEGTVEVEHLQLKVTSLMSSPLPLEQGIIEEKWLLQEKLKTLESEYEDRIHKLTDKETGREDVINVAVPLQEEKFSAEKIAKIVDSLSSEVIEKLSSDVVHELDLYKTQVGYKAAVVEAMVEPRTTGNHPITR